MACHARRVRAAETDAFVLDALRTFRLPDSAIEAVRAELERRRKAHKPGDIDRQRERLEGTLARLGQRFDWGELPDTDYRQKVTEVRRQLAALPSPDDKIILFDRYRSEVRSFPETLDAASDEKVREFGRRCSSSAWRRPTGRLPGWSGQLRRGRSSRLLRCSAWRPRTDSNRRRHLRTVPLYPLSYGGLASSYRGEPDPRGCEPQPIRNPL